MLSMQQQLLNENLTTLNNMLRFRTCLETWDVCLGMEILEDYNGGQQSVQVNQY